MSNEITSNVTWSIENGNFKDEAVQRNQRFTQQGTGYAAGLISTTTTPVQVDFGNVTTPGVMILTSMDSSTSTSDPTTYIKYGPTSGCTYGRLNPRDMHLFRLQTGSTELWVKSTSGTPAVKFQLYNN